MKDGITSIEHVLDENNVLVRRSLESIEDNKEVYEILSIKKLLSN